MLNQIPYCERFLRNFNVNSLLAAEKKLEAAWKLYFYLHDKFIY